MSQSKASRIIGGAFDALIDGVLFGGQFLTLATAFLLIVICGGTLALVVIAGLYLMDLFRWCWRR